MSKDGRARQMTRDEAQQLAVDALVYVGANEPLLTRFASLTGIEIAEMRKAAAQPGFLCGVLDFLLGHEPDVLAFAHEQGVTPDQVLAARNVLSGGDPEPWQSI